MKLVIFDSLTSPLSAYLVPAVSSESVKAQEASESMQQMNRKRKRKSGAGLPGFVTQDSAHSLVRMLLATVVKDTLKALAITRMIAVRTPKVSEMALSL